MQAQLEKVILGSMPGLSDPGQREELENFFEQTFERAVGEAIEGFYQRFESRLGSARESIAGFDSCSEQDSVDLNKRFIQLWLQLLEEEVMSQ